MFYRTIFFALLLLIGFQTAFAQTIEKEKPKVVTAELRKEAVAFLRETSGEVNSLRSLENRISFSSEMASLMWFYDEKEAAVMYQSVISDFKQLLAQYDSQMNTLDITPNESDSRENFFGRENPSDKGQLRQKFYKAIGIRQQIAMNLAEHDATLAYNFFYDTQNIVSNATLRKLIEDRDLYFEVELMRRIATKDAARAAEFGRKSIAKGVNWSHLDLLEKIYEKDNDKGAEFADEIVKKLKNEKIAPESYYNIAAFINAGTENLEKIKKVTGKKPMFSEQNMRDMTDILAQSILQKTDTNNADFSRYTALIEKYAPSRAAQIRAKLANQTNKVKPAEVESEESVEPNTVVSATIPPKVETQIQARKEQDEMMKSLENLGSKELTKEEREKTVAQARKIIGGMGKKEEKIMALSLLAGQVAKLGDKELAADIMKDAQALVNPSPKNYRDFLEIWFLVSVYLETDPDKAFPILDDAIFRLNDTLSAFIKVGEFIDVSGEMIDDGEVQVGSFGGSVISGLTGELGIANATLRNLAIADFGKTKALTNRFDRTEVRILAKMLILRAILGDKAEKKDAELEKEVKEF
ncbi:MAG: hypothetical protein ABJA66_14155 [Actinomycetota bacterium]